MCRNYPFYDISKPCLTAACAGKEGKVIFEIFLKNKTNVIRILEGIRSTAYSATMRYSNHKGGDQRNSLSSAVVGIVGILVLTVAYLEMNRNRLD